MKLFLAILACIFLTCSSAMAQMGRRGGGTQVATQNRSANRNAAANRNVNDNRNYNSNTNYNRNVNVNSNVNVNRNVNVYGGGCCYYHDNDWNWGSFAAGAAVGVATTAVVASATHPSTVVVAAPAVGTMVTTLPGSCATVSSGGAVIYNCSNVYYRPYYQGTTLVYQVVTYP